jgi:hypothetical protein
MRIIPIVVRPSAHHVLIMELHVKKLALRSAAKVAFGTMMVGCGGTMAVSDAGEPQDASNPKNDASSIDSSTDGNAADVAQIEDATGDGALACTPPVEVDGGDPGAEVFACCLGVVEAITGDAGFIVADAGEVTGDPSVDNCCKAIIAHVDNDTPDYSAAEQALPTCCNALASPMGPACTPWGPPMPPEMDATDARLA